MAEHEAQLDIDASFGFVTANAEPETTAYRTTLSRLVRAVVSNVPDLLSDQLLDPTTRALQLSVRRHLASLAAVVAVVAYIDRADDGVELITLVDSVDPDARYQVYPQELKLARDLPDLHISFRVVNLRDYSRPRDFSIAELGGEILYERADSSDDYCDWLVGQYAHTGGAPTTSKTQRALLQPA